MEKSMNLLEQLSDSLADAIARARGSVVTIEARRRFPSSGVIWSESGLIATNDHVIQRTEGIRVTLDGDRVYSARIVGRDATTDIALLQIEETGLDAAARESSASLRAGNVLLPLARPGRSVRASFGIVSACGDAWRPHSGGTIDRFIQSDASLYPGFAGGPMIDARGVVRGITTTIFVRGAAVMIPVETIERVAASLTQHGHVPRAYIGVSTYPVELPQQARTDVPQDVGLLIVAVDADSPAQQAGLLVGDIIVSLAGQSVDDLDTLVSALQLRPIGATSTVRIVRGGAAVELPIVVGDRSAQK
jgi:S1-C subfamily serine protease